MVPQSESYFNTRKLNLWLTFPTGQLDFSNWLANISKTG